MTPKLTVAASRLITLLDEPSVSIDAFDNDTKHSLVTAIEDTRAALMEVNADPSGGAPRGARALAIVVTEEMHAAACKVLIRANGLDGLPQRMLDAMLAAAPTPTAPTDVMADASLREYCARGAAIDRACIELPAGCEIRIDLERGAGTVTIIDTEGRETLIEGGDLYSEQIKAAIDAARAAEKGTPA